MTTHEDAHQSELFEENASRTPMLVGSYRYLESWGWGVEYWLAEHGMGGELAGHREKMLEGITRRIAIAQSALKRVSLHGPATVPPPGRVVEKLARSGVDVVVHAGAIGRRRRWRVLKEHLLIENMDSRGGRGRTTEELDEIFSDLPKARLCLDVSHTLDHSASGELCQEIAERYHGRIGEVHVGCGRGEDVKGQPLSELEVALAVTIARVEGVPLVIERHYTQDQLAATTEELRDLLGSRAS